MKGTGTLNKTQIIANTCGSKPAERHALTLWTGYAMFVLGLWAEMWPVVLVWPQFPSWTGPVPAWSLPGQSFIWGWSGPYLSGVAVACSQTASQTMMSD